MRLTVLAGCSSAHNKEKEKQDKFHRAGMLEFIPLPYTRNHPLRILCVNFINYFFGKV